jgi:hypothetical protein
LKRIQRMPNIPLAYVSVYRRMSDIFHTLTYACTIRNSVTGPLMCSMKHILTALSFDRGPPFYMRLIDGLSMPSNSSAMTVLQNRSY